jgi:acyl-CoA thioesterase FadM
MTFHQRIKRNDETLVEQTISAATVTTAGRPTRIPIELVEALQGPG